MPCPVFSLAARRATVPADEPTEERCIASVARLDTFHWSASCTCGWNERPVMLRATAVVQALEHCTRGKCLPAQPLLVPRPVVCSVVPLPLSPASDVNVIERRRRQKSWSIVKGTGIW
ncbi:MAG: hypothetical protein PGN27_22950 [Mycolicibacterium neoaurum]|uniref:hypothetical protein n=1 Tax=Mycolicibacterium neoaurum TaxID=1795 RepID=UPI002FF65153